jgi:hypothetical protein
VAKFDTDYMNAIDMNVNELLVTTAAVFNILEACEAVSFGKNEMKILVSITGYVGLKVKWMCGLDFYNREVVCEEALP